MTIHIEIFSQGEELLIGQTVDTNAAWLSEQLVALGFKVTRHTTVGDSLENLIALLHEISARADCCLCTGGLGPTNDDLTAEAVAQAFNRPLIFDPVAFKQIQVFFAQRQHEMPESNLKQALLPESATRIDNQWGTAPGFSIRHQRCWFAFMPGVPYEMRQLFTHSIKPKLIDTYPTQPDQRITFKTIGIGESAIQQRLKNISLPNRVQLGFRTSDEENQTKLIFPYNYPESEKLSLVEQFTLALGDYVFAIDGLHENSGDLVATIGAILESQKLTLTVLETLSQGLIAAKCIGQPWLLHASYQQITHNFLKSFDLQNHADDWSTLASELAERQQRESQADLALVQLHHADDAQLRDKDQAVTLYNALATGRSVHTQTITVAGPLRRKQNQAALMALDLLRRFLQHKTL